MPAGSIHDLRSDAFEYAWDNSFEPALEIESGETVLLHVRDASDEQINASSGTDDVLKLDFSHVNPVSGPIFVKGAHPGDALAVELALAELDLVTAMTVFEKAKVELDRATGATLEHNGIQLQNAVNGTVADTISAAHP